MQDQQPRGLWYSSCLREGSTHEDQLVRSGIRRVLLELHVGQVGQRLPVGCRVNTQLRHRSLMSVAAQPSTTWPPSDRPDLSAETHKSVEPEAVNSLDLLPNGAQGRNRLLDLKLEPSVLLLRVDCVSAGIQVHTRNEAYSAGDRQ